MASTAIDTIVPSAPSTSAPKPVSSSSSASTSSSSSLKKCGSCGSTSIDIDPGRAEAVCTNCGDVLESSLIVADIQFEENAHGGSSAIGQFVSSETRGGGSGGGGFSGGGGGGGGRHRGGGGLAYGGISGIGRESREITLRNARNKIRALGQQLSLRQDKIDIAFNFFRMALSRNLTRGRKSTHVIAACVYITCRTEGTSHMLIDFSDILQIDVYELGRTYLRLSQELCINIPAMDPCLYVMRFAHKLEFGEKTHEVSMTALRLVSRMKKDWIHFGRRPSGLCGAALLIASRLHNFHRTVTDIIKVVKVHESTLRKRLNEFGETPASQLTLDEFMNVDLDAMTEEQDPPSFKAARRKDKERLTMLEEECDVEEELSELQTEIERQLAERRAKARGPYARFAKEIVPLEGCGASSSSAAHNNLEEMDVEKFIAEQTLGTIREIVSDDPDSVLMPPPSTSRKSVIASPGLGLKDTIQEYLVSPTSSSTSSTESSGFRGKKEEGSHKNDDDDEEGKEDEIEELDLTGIDDDEIDGYIMSENEIKFKTDLWMRVNADYLREKAEKEEKERLEEEEAIKEGREVKKKKQRVSSSKAKQKMNMGGNQTAIEAIEKIVQEKKISTKINYDVLRSLNMVTVPTPVVSKEEKRDDSPLLSSPPEPKRLKTERPVSSLESEPSSESEPIIESGPVHAAEPEELEEETHEEELEEEDESCLSAAQLLRKHRGDSEVAGDDDYYEEEFY